MQRLEGSPRGVGLTPGQEPKPTPPTRSCMPDGLSNSDMAERLGVTPNTVRIHVQLILYKLDVHSKLEAVVVKSRKGL